MYGCNDLATKFYLILCALDWQKLMLQPAAVATKVVCLTQVVSPDELKDDDDYQDILEDMREECGKFGKTLVYLVLTR